MPLDSRRIRHGRLLGNHNGEKRDHDKWDIRPELPWNAEEAELEALNWLVEADQIEHTKPRVEVKVVGFRRAAHF